MHHVPHDVPMIVLPSRRLMLGGAAVTVIGAACGCNTSLAQESPEGGCWLPAAAAAPLLARITTVQAFSEGTEQMEPRSGNTLLDRALARGLATISKTFGILPGFAYYQEPQGVNAKATPQTLMGRTDGTVMFGLSLLQRLLSSSHADAAILAVCAHEFGHIVSYKNQMINQLASNPAQPYKAEQFADFMAGYYAGTRRLLNANYPAVIFASTQNAFGGGDHGSGQQRAEAVQEGYLTAYQRRLAIDDATRAAFDFAIHRQL